MKIKYNNLYTHFVLTTLNHEPVLPEKNKVIRSVLTLQYIATKVIVFLFALNTGNKVF